MENKSLEEVTPREIKISLPVERKEAGGNNFVRILPTIITTILSVFITYADLVSYGVGEIETKKFIILFIVAALIFIAGLVYLAMSIAFRKTTKKIKVKSNTHKYDKYLKKEEEKFKKIIEEEKQELNDRYITSIDDNKYLYRNIKSNLFTSISLGIGDVEVNNKIIFDTNLYNEDETMMLKVAKLINKYRIIKDVPYGINIRRKKSMAIVNNTSSYEKYINYIMFQLVKYHDPNELKLIILTGDNNTFKELEGTSFTIGDTSLYAKNIKEAKDVMKRTISNKKTYYLIVTDDYSTYNTLIDEYITVFDNLGLLIFDKSYTNISINIKTVVLIDEGKGKLTTINDSVLEESKFIPILFKEKVKTK